jgi:hypothetical protein
MQVRLSKPFVVGDKTVSKTVETANGSVYMLVLDVESMTGKDIDYCAREAGAMRGLAVPGGLGFVTDHEFHIQVAAKACGQTVGALKELPARDYVEVATAVQSFLTGSD